jgi:predicted PurR-regulated permease PerM
MTPTASGKTSTSDRLTTVLSYGTLLLLGYLVYRISEPFLVPLAWSAVLAIFFYPLHSRLEQRFGRNQAALLSSLGVTLLLIVPTLVILGYATREAIATAAKLQSSLLDPQRALPAQLLNWVRHHLPAQWQSADFSQPLRQAAETIAAFLAGKFTAVVKNLFTLLLDLFILIFALFFMFRDADSMVRGLRHLMLFDEEIQDEVLQESHDLVFASVAVALVIAGIQGVLGGLAFTIAGISSPLFWAVLIAFFSLVPVVGSALIWVPAALWLVLTGSWGKGLEIVAVCGGVTAVADNIVRPLLLRNRTHLNELLLFVSVLGGLEVFGLLGLVVGPTIMAAAMGVFRVYMQHHEKQAATTA